MSGWMFSLAGSVIAGVVLISTLSLVVALVLARRFFSNQKTQESIEKLLYGIDQGSKAFLDSQYRWAGFGFVLVMVVLLLVKISFFVMALWQTLAFFSGALVASAGAIIAVFVSQGAAARTVGAAHHSLSLALRVALSAGGIIGYATNALVVLMLLFWYFLLPSMSTGILFSAEILFSFCLGFTVVALFLRVGGGIFAKGANISVDLLDKLDAGIPSQDVRNPVTASVHVGDGTARVAGFAADLMESYVATLLATLILAAAAVDRLLYLVPLVVVGLGIFTSLLAAYFIRLKKDDFAMPRRLPLVLRAGIVVSGFLLAVFSYLVVVVYLEYNLPVFLAIAAGISSGLLIHLFSGYYSSLEHLPTRQVTESSESGAAAVIITGLAYGMRSTAAPILMITVFLALVYFLNGTGSEGLFAIGLMGVSMQATLSLILSLNSFSPIAESAGRIAEVSGLENTVQERTREVTFLGSTVAAAGRGYSVAAAGMATMVMIAALHNLLHKFNPEYNLSEPAVILGFFTGSLIPFYFSGFVLSAVNRTAQHMVAEVSRQFREIKGLMEGESKPEYYRCVKISMEDSLRKMLVPVLLALLAPLLAALLFGPAGLVSLLLGALVTGFPVAMMMVNAGGAWNNARLLQLKENRATRGSAAYNAAVIGDIIGEPFKDTIGPAINMLLKLMAVIALLFGTALTEVYLHLFS